MQDYPHRYRAAASAAAEGVFDTTSPGLEAVPTMAPPEFGGPGDKWSPETMLVASVASCLILTFRAIARASRFDWDTLTCDVVGVLDRVERVTQFTQFVIDVSLHVPEGTDVHKAQRLVEKSKEICLVTNSLTGAKTLNVAVVQDG